MSDLMGPQPFKAIETKYRGCSFRSRLEARWAVVFDALGIKWQYEPQAFEVGGTYYLPDFWLPETQTWVEVKGSAAQMDWHLMNRAAQGVGGLPGLLGSGEGTRRGLLVLGQIPDLSLFTDSAIALHFMLQSDKDGVHPVAASLHPRLGVVPTTNWDYAPDVNPILTQLPVDRLVARWAVPVRDGYRQGRGARFEHGQFGSPLGWESW